MFSAVPHTTHMTSSSTSGSVARGAAARRRARASASDEQRGEQRAASRPLPQQRRHVRSSHCCVDRPAARGGDPAPPVEQEGLGIARLAEVAHVAAVGVAQAGIGEPVLGMEASAASVGLLDVDRRARSRPRARSFLWGARAAAARRGRAAPRGPEVHEHDLARGSRPASRCRVPPSTGRCVRADRPACPRASRRRSSCPCPCRRRRRRAGPTSAAAASGHGPVEARAHGLPRVSALPARYPRYPAARAGVVQWLRRWLPKPEMGVRFPSPACRLRRGTGARATHPPVRGGSDPRLRPTRPGPCRSAGRRRRWRPAR